MSKILVSNSNQYFDDCPICQAMKKAEKQNRDLSEKEVKQAFKKAKKVKGAVVGDIINTSEPVSNN